MPADHLKHRFLELTKVAFCVGQEEENELKVHCEHFKHRFLNFTQVAFWSGEEAGNEFTVPEDHLKISILYMSQVAIWAVQEMKVQCEHLKHRFLELTKSYFLLVKGQKKS